MKKRLFVLVAMATLILGFSSCDININFTPSKANFYFKNDTDEDIDDWAMVNFDDYVDNDCYIDKYLTLYKISPNGNDRVYSGRTGGPVSVDYDERAEYFPIWMYPRDKHIYGPLDKNNRMYVCYADGDYTFSLYYWDYTPRTAETSEKKKMLRLKDGTLLEIAPIGEVTSDGSYIFY